MPFSLTFTPIMSLRPTSLFIFVPAFAATLSFAPHSAGAVQIGTEWSYEISVQPGAPTPDAASKLVVRTASLFGSVAVATGRDEGTITGNSYSLRSRVEGAPLLAMAFSNSVVQRQSDGRFINGVALTMRYVEKRGTNDELTTTTNLAARRYEFRKGRQLVHVEQFTLAASDLLSAPYAFLGKPAPTGIAFLALTDGRRIQRITMTSRRENVELDGRAVPAVRLSGLSTAGAFVLWLRPEDSYPLRMRVGLGPKYGAVLEQVAKRVPREVVRL